MIDILRTRRSIRQYKNKIIEPEKMEILKEASLRAPSSRGINPRRLFFVTDKGLLEILSRAKTSGSSFLKNAALGVVVCAKQDDSDVWIEDCSIASIILQLVGQSLGLGSCWIQIRNRKYDNSKSSEEYVRQAAGISKELSVECMVAFGYADEDKGPINKDELEYEKILSC